MPSDYVARGVALLRATGAACAGGPIVAVPNGRLPWARAVAVVTRHRLGVGNSAFRTGRGSPPRFVDTVPNGVFLRAPLLAVGLFDERLTRNQDNELSARLRRAGHRVAFHPDLRSRYWNQPSLRGLARQGFRTGMWNVYTARLAPYAAQPRHFVPAAFVLYLALLAAAAASRAPSALLAAPLALYAALVAAVAAAAGRAGGGGLRVAATVVSYHLSYGAGTHCGVANLLTGRWRRQLGQPLNR
jgi:hypothetical protein